MVARYPLAWDRFEVAYVAICPAPGSDYWEFAKYHLHDTLVGLWTNYRRKWHEVSCQVSEHGNKWYKTARESRVSASARASSPVVGSLNLGNIGCRGPFFNLSLNRFWGCFDQPSG